MDDTAGRKSREATRRWRLTNPERARSKTREWRERNREKFLASNRKSKRKYYQKNRDRILAYQREYERQNHERLLAGRRKYMAAHQEENRRRAREWWHNHHGEALLKLRARSRAYSKDPERIAVKKAWTEANRDRVRDYVRVSTLRRRARGGPGPTAAQWRATLTFWDKRCAYCGTGGKLEADHRIPLARGGTSAKENIIPACPGCNRRKHTMTEGEFRLFLLLEREPLDVAYTA